MAAHLMTAAAPSLCSQASLPGQTGHQADRAGLGLNGGARPGRHRHPAAGGAVPPGAAGLPVRPAAPERSHMSPAWRAGVAGPQYARTVPGWPPCRGARRLQQQYVHLCRWGPASELAGAGADVLQTAAAPLPPALQALCQRLCSLRRCCTLPARQPSQVPRRHVQGRRGGAPGAARRGGRRAGSVQLRAALRRRRHGPSPPG